jgi:2-aminobenzoate-CoA ligase
MFPTGHLDTFARDNLPPRALMPELIFELPELCYPERLNCAVELLDKTVALGHGERIAIRSFSGNWPYRRLLDRVDRIAHVLIRCLKLQPGNRVLLRGLNDPMMAACWLAVVKAGLIAVTTTPLLRAKELRQILDRAQIGTALCDASFREELDLAQVDSPVLQQVLYFNTQATESIEERLVAAPPERFASCDTAADDVCLIAFTSGTSGSPKATVHFHRDVMAICDCFPRSILHVDSDDVFCGTPPLGFTFGLGGLLLFPMRFAASTLLLGRLTPESLLQSIQDYRATICFTVPTFYRQMAPLVSRYDIRSLKQAVSAGEALPLATRELWLKATGFSLIDGLGATELLHIFISASNSQICPGATGRPIPGYRACVLDEQGCPLPAGRVGRLAIKGPTGCRYLADDRQNSYVRDGWNLTGDACLIDTHGCFWYRGRTDDMIITAGNNVAGAEVEEALLRHPAVLECGVIGIPDEKRGQIVKAVVVLNVGFEPSEDLIKSLQEYVKSTIAPFKYPRAIEFRSSLPRTETGKLQRFKLRESDKRRIAEQEIQ